MLDATVVIIATIPQRSQDKFGCGPFLSVDESGEMVASSRGRHGGRECFLIGVSARHAG